VFTSQEVSVLKFNESTDSFILYTKDEKKAENAGLTLSNNIRGPAGDRVYFTADHNMKPVFNPYAVLDFYDEADDKAADFLHGLAKDYRASWADGTVGTYPSYPVPDGREYMPFQTAAVYNLLDHGGGIIADEPGLGKTIQAIAYANALGAKSVLVIVPAAVRLQWKREILLWSVIPKVTVETIFAGSQSTWNSPNYLVCSYDLARNHGIHAAICSRDWDLLITDEGHYLKTNDALRTRAIFGGGDGYFHDKWIAKHCDHHVSLTGTPLPNRPRESYVLARGMNWPAIDYLSKDAFMYRYNPSVRSEITGRNIEKKGRLPELNARLRCSVPMIRRLKADVLPQLPPKRYEMTYLEPNGNVQRILKEEALIDFDPKVLFNPDFKLGGTPISTLRREMGEAMVPEVLEYLKYQINIVELPKIIVFAHHKVVIAAIAEGLARHGVVLHVGGMSPKKKAESIHRFVNDPRVGVFLGQLDTMEGVDGLQTVTEHVFFPEAAWTPRGNEQCVDRAHRMGQRGDVIARFLLIEGSFNEKVLHTVMSKVPDIHETLDRRLIT